LLFSQPVHLHFELADLLKELFDEPLLLALPSACRAALEDPRAGVEEPAFPLRDLHRMHAKLAGQLVEGLLALDRLQRDLRLERATMPPARRSSSPSSRSWCWFCAHTLLSFPSWPLLL
jgi:hypothetical protein